MPRTEEGTGWKGQPTSREAAEKAAPGAAMIRDQIISMMRANSRAMSADEIAEALGLSILSVRPRVSELARAGKLVNSGQRAINRSGNTAARWKLTATARG